METEEEIFVPPSSPPPFLQQDQLIHLATQGWLPITLPSLTTTTVNKLFESLSTFFSLQQDRKELFYPPKLGTEFGYYHVPEEKEYLTLRCSVHGSSSPGDIEENASNAWSQLGSILHRTLCDLARASDPPLEWHIWDGLLDGTLKLPSNENDVTGTLLRMFRYKPGSGVAEQHTDLGLLTICIGDGARGLQMLDRVNSTADTEDGRIWVDAEGPVMLVGQTLRALSNGMIRTGVHRVIASEAGRESVVFTLRHSFRHVIDLSQFGLMDFEAGEEDWEKRRYVDPKLLMDKLKAGVVNVNAKKDIREAQRREKQAKGKARVFENENSVIETRGQG